jgi:hypothetical protein
MSDRETDAGYEDQAAEFIAGVQRIAALGLPQLPDDPAAAAAMRAAGYEVLAECTEAGDVAIVRVLSEDEHVRHVVKLSDLAAALGVDAGDLAGRQFIATMRETPETGPVLSGFRPVPVAE